jgi:Ni/Co efflux regulator RcnB
MNKLAKTLLLAIAFAAPVAISAPSVQAKTATSSQETVSTPKAHTTGHKAAKNRKRHHSRRPKASHTQGQSSFTKKPVTSTTPKAGSIPSSIEPATGNTSPVTTPIPKN